VIIVTFVLNKCTQCSWHADQWAKNYIDPKNQLGKRI